MDAGTACKFDSISSPTFFSGFPLSIVADRKETQLQNFVEPVT